MNPHFQEKPLMDSSKFIWVTRSAPYNFLTGHHLRAAGHKPLIIPVLTIRPWPHATVMHPPAALIFTSVHGVQQQQVDRRFVDLPVFTVGRRTAMAAREAGYRAISSADGDVSDLERLIVDRLPAGATLLHFSAAEPAGNLPAALERHGLSVRQIIVYESEDAETETLGPALAALPWIDGILVHSAKAGRRIAPFIADCGRHWNGTIHCISAAAAAPLREVTDRPVLVAATPDEQAMLALVGNHSTSLPNSASEAITRSEPCPSFRTSAG
jgi:uroporphyrinogen-III synthase